MVKFLEFKDIKKGYKLGDLLTKTCFIEGSETIYQLFSNSVRAVLKATEEEQRTSILKQLEEDLDNLNMYVGLSAFIFNKNVNIKQIVYRGITLFISALGRYHDLNERSCFEIIDELQRKKIISDFTAHKFSIAVAVACHIRLFYYLSKKQQDDKIYKEGDFRGREKLKELTKIVSINTFVDCLQTAFLLQLLLIDEDLELNAFDSYYHRNITTIQMDVLNSLGLYHDTIRLGENTVLHQNDWQVIYHLGRAYMSLALYDRCLEMHQRMQSCVALNNPMIVYNELACLMENPDKHILVAEKIDDLLKSSSRAEAVDGFLRLKTLNDLRLSRFQESLSASRDLLKRFKNMKHYVEKKFHYREVYAGYIRNIAFALMGLKKDEQSLHWALEGRNLLDIVETSANNYDWFIHIISFHQIQPTMLVPDFSERPSPIKTRCFTTTTGINATCFTNKRQFQKTDDSVTAKDRNVSLDIFSRAKITTILLGKRSTPARF